MTPHELIYEVYGYIPKNTPNEWEAFDTGIESVTGQKMVRDDVERYKDALLFMKEKALKRIYGNSN